MMEQEYNWNLILMAALPVSIIEAYLIYKNVSPGWRWFSVILGLALTGGVIYLKDKRKSNVFTGMAIVVLAVLSMVLLKSIGFF